MAQVMVGKGSDVVGIYLGCFSDFSWIITAFFNGIGIGIQLVSFSDLLVLLGSAVPVISG